MRHLRQKIENLCHVRLWPVFQRKKMNEPKKHHIPDNQLFTNKNKSKEFCTFLKKIAEFKTVLTFESPNSTTLHKKAF
jgi:hypothetical protein